MKLPWLISILLLAFLLTPDHLSAGEPPIKINLADRRAEIRTTLLKYTPLGTRSGEVLAFIQQRLLPKGSTPPPLQNRPASGPSAEASQKRGVQRLKVNLGDYPNLSLLLLLPAFPFEQSLQAQWAFDKNDHLIELFLDRGLDNEIK